MKALLLISMMLFSGQSFAASMDVKVNLIPTGNFYAKTEEVTGAAQKIAKGFSAQGIVVNLKSLKTGVKLRDEHLQAKLDTENYPTAELLEAKGTGGKGVARLKMRGKTFEVKGSYVVEGQQLEAKFSFPLAMVDMSGIKHMNVRVQEIVEVTVRVPIE